MPHAVKWNIDRVRHPNRRYPALSSNGLSSKEVIVVDDLTVDILTTEKPHAYRSNGTSATTAVS